MGREKRFLALLLSMNLVLVCKPANTVAEPIKSVVLDSEDRIESWDGLYDSIEYFEDGGKDYIFYVDGVENHYFVPPEDFDPLEATDEELARYGYPEKPDESNAAAYEEWVELMSNYTGTPDLEYEISEEPVNTETDNTGEIYEISSVTSKYSQTRSGYVANLSGTSTLFTQVQMDYVQPTVSEVSGTCVNFYWVGIGGWLTEKLVQAGTATSGKSTHYAWYEYLSDTGKSVSVIKLSSLTISAGDSIHVYISFQRANNLFNYYVANNTTGKSVSGTVSLTASTQYDGLTAEWMVERATQNGVITKLGNYGSITLKNCKATINTSSSWKNLSSFSNLYKVTMTNTGSASGTKLSVPGSISSDNSFSCTWKAYGTSS